MPVFKLITKNHYKDSNAVESLLHYITRNDKTESYLIGGYGIYPYSTLDEIALQFQCVKYGYRKTNGVQLQHFLISFDYEEWVSDYQVYNLAYHVAAYYDGQFQVAYAVHHDTLNVHVHFIVNSVSYVDGHKMDFGKDDFWLLASHVYYSIAGEYSHWKLNEKSKLKKLVVTYEKD